MNYVKVKCNCKKRLISQNKFTRMKNGTVYICKNCNKKIKFCKKDKDKSIQSEIKRLEKRKKRINKEITILKLLQNKEN